MMAVRMEDGLADQDRRLIILCVLFQKFTQQKCLLFDPLGILIVRKEIYLFPNDENAKRIKQQTFLLSEFLEKYAKNYQPPVLVRKAVLHPHCHHKALMKTTAEENVLSKLGLDYELLSAGCCGMAGGFGFEKEHYEVSIAVGERILLPIVRNTPTETMIIEDEF